MKVNFLCTERSRPGRTGWGRAGYEVGLLLDGEGMAVVLEEEGEEGEKEKWNVISTQGDEEEKTLSVTDVCT